MSRTVSQAITMTVAVTALSISAANFVIGRIAAREESAVRKREDGLRIDQLLDTAFELLYGRDGYSRAKDGAKLSEAEVAVTQALGIDSVNPRAVEYEGHLLEAHGNTKSAAERYEKSISIDPSRSRPYNCLGLISTGEEAIKYFTKAIDLDPERAAFPCYNLGKVHASAGRLLEAKRYFQQAIELRPQFPHAHYELGELLEEEGRLEEARKAYEKAIAGDAGYVRPMVSLGALMMKNLGTAEDGLAWLEHAMKVDPADDFPLAMLAAIYADNKDAERALDYAKRAMALNPSRRFLGDVFHDLRREMDDRLEKREPDSPP